MPDFDMGEYADWDIASQGIPPKIYDAMLGRIEADVNSIEPLAAAGKVLESAFAYEHALKGGMLIMACGTQAQKEHFETWIKSHVSQAAAEEAEQSDAEDFLFGRKPDNPALN